MDRIGVYLDHMKDRFDMRPQDSINLKQAAEILTELKKAPKPIKPIG